MPMPISIELKRPASPSRNFHTLPLTTGGSAQMNTMSPSTNADSRVDSASRMAAPSPPTRPITVTTTTKSAVLPNEMGRSPCAIPFAKLPKPTNSHGRLRVADVTVLTLIRSSCRSGNSENTARNTAAGSRNISCVLRRVGGLRRVARPPDRLAVRRLASRVPVNEVSAVMIVLSFAGSGVRITC
jgi:hypothetical protein